MDTKFKMPKTGKMQPPAVSVRETKKNTGVQQLGNVKRQIMVDMLRGPNAFSQR